MPGPITVKGNVFVITEHGDDYHGSRTVVTYQNEEDANAEARELESNQIPCSQCSHRYSYQVTKVDLL